MTEGRDRIAPRSASSRCSAPRPPLHEASRSRRAPRADPWLDGSAHLFADPDLPEHDAAATAMDHLEQSKTFLAGL
jgi:hypothetical protein